MSPISQGLKQFKIFWLYLTSSNTQSVLLPWNFSWDNLAALYVDMHENLVSLASETFLFLNTDHH